MSNRVVTPVCRISFPNLFQPKGFGKEGTGEKKYSATFLFDAAAQATPEFKKLQAAVEAVIKDKWGEKRPTKLKLPFQNGDEKPETAGYPGHVYINASSRNQPEVVDNQLNSIIEADQVYGGMYVKASLEPYGYDFNGTKGVSFGLGNVQKVKDGERFVKKVAADQDFAPVDDADPALEKELFNQ